MPNYLDIPIIKLPNGKRMYQGIKYPNIPLSPADMYVICNNTDRYDKLADQYYGDSNLWWVISIANNSISQDSLFPPVGSYIRIPSNYVDVVDDFNTLNDIENSELSSDY